MKFKKFLSMGLIMAAVVSGVYMVFKIDKKNTDVNKKNTVALLNEVYDSAINQDVYDNVAQFSEENLEENSTYRALQDVTNGLVDDLLSGEELSENLDDYKGYLNEITKEKIDNKTSLAVDLNRIGIIRD